MRERDARLEQTRSYYQENKERYAIWRRRAKLRSYGLSEDDFISMVDAQHGRCAICGAECELVVDHDHETGKVRGLLCRNCNLALGFLEDSIFRFETAAVYLQRSSRD